MLVNVRVVVGLDVLLCGDGALVAIPRLHVLELLDKVMAAAGRRVAAGALVILGVGHFSHVFGLGHNPEAVVLISRQASPSSMN